MAFRDGFAAFAAELETLSSGTQGIVDFAAHQPAFVDVWLLDAVKKTSIAAPDIVADAAFCGTLAERGRQYGLGIGVRGPSAGAFTPYTHILDEPRRPKDGDTLHTALLPERVKELMDKVRLEDGRLFEADLVYVGLRLLSTLPLHTSGELAITRPRKIMGLGIIATKHRTTFIRPAQGSEPYRQLPPLLAQL
jgi:hypothetical protein